jgi:hypothetical protein
MKTIKVRIPAIVTTDGKWAAMASSGAGGEPDWEYLFEMCDYENPTKGPRRFWIEAELPVPDDTEVTVSAGEVAAA